MISCDSKDSCRPFSHACDAHENDQRENESGGDEDEDGSKPPFAQKPPLFILGPHLLIEVGHRRKTRKLVEVGPVDKPARKCLAVDARVDMGNPGRELLDLRRELVRLWDKAGLDGVHRRREALQLII